ncbi:hypothetical protein ACHAQH_009886 [Verticillium albo-atrum]
MSGPSEDLLPDAYKLQGSGNWNEWTARMVPILARHGLLFIIKIREPRADVMEMKNAEAMDLINQNCSPQVLNAQDGPCSNAWILWKRLDHLYSYHHSGIALDPRDFREFLRKDVHDFNAAFNERLRQIYGGRFWEADGNTPAARLLYYELVGEIYEDWDMLKRGENKWDRDVSLYAIQDDLVEFVCWRREASNRRERAVSPGDLSSKENLTPNSDDEQSDSGLQSWEEESLTGGTDEGHQRDEGRQTDDGQPNWTPHEESVLNHDLLKDEAFELASHESDSRFTTEEQPPKVTDDKSRKWPSRKQMQQANRSRRNETQALEVYRHPLLQQRACAVRCALVIQSMAFFWHTEPTICTDQISHRGFLSRDDLPRYTSHLRPNRLSPSSRGRDPDPDSCSFLDGTDGLENACG